MGHISRRLAAFVDGELNAQDATRVARHIEQCARCRADVEHVRSAKAMLEQLPVVEAPDAIWKSIEAAQREKRTPRTSPGRRWRGPRWPVPGWPLALGTTAALVLVAMLSWRLAHQTGTRWTVVSLSGLPAAGSTQIRRTSQIGAGEWIETDSGSRATIKVGDIGSVEVAPNTRLRIVTAKADDHRLALARGEIRATISAPPRLFFVETASGTAVDLGCEYTLTADGDGVGVLHVTRGWVAFEWIGLESLVPAGATCRTRPHEGPGIPYFDDASDRLKGSLATLGVEKTETDSLNVILSESRVRDTLTLWHLLSRVEADDRERVYDRMAELTPVPAGISRELALRLDPDTLKRWREELAWAW
jgi:hypothetical protein